MQALSWSQEVFDITKSFKKESFGWTASIVNNVKLSLSEQVALQSVFTEKKNIVLKSSWL
jgi:hypothetical protein